MDEKEIRKMALEELLQNENIKKSPEMLKSIQADYDALMAAESETQEEVDELEKARQMREQHLSRIFGPDETYRLLEEERRKEAEGTLDERTPEEKEAAFQRDLAELLKKQRK